MTLGQQEPVVPRMLYQPPTGLDQTLLQSGQRPVADRLGQRQPPPEVSQIVSQHAQPQPYLIGTKAVAAKPRHRDRLLALFNPLFGGAALVVEAHYCTV